METVQSADGTPIAYDHRGEGPPLVLVHGVTSDHRKWDAIRPDLEERYTVYAMDRRGRGRSGDADEFALEREYRDVVAVVDAAADAAAESVHLLGHSYGALCALEAAPLIDDLRTLVLYEPTIPVGGRSQYPPERVEAMRRHLDAGDRESVLTTFFEERTADQIEQMRSRPDWAARVAAAHTLLREIDAIEAYEFDPDRFATLTAPAYLLLGGESPESTRETTETVARALPESHTVVLPGQGHVAMDSAPDLFLDTVLDVLDGPPDE